jgi:[ribosomal protein S5]-alanine N-acetyltransferase
VTLPTIALGVPGWQLRAWRPEDAASLAEHANNPAVWRNMSEGFPHPYTLALAQHWVQQGHVDFGGDNWAITWRDEAVGGCGVHTGSGGLRCNAEIGYWLAQRHWGQGIGTRVAAALTERALADPQVTRVFAPVHAYNPASIRVLEHCGFEREALLRLSALKAGTVIDRVLMVRLRPGLHGGMPPLPTLQA